MYFLSVTFKDGQTQEHQMTDLEESLKGITLSGWIRSCQRLVVTDHNSKLWIEYTRPAKMDGIYQQYELGFDGDEVATTTHTNGYTMLIQSLSLFRNKNIATGLRDSAICIRKQDTSDIVLYVRLT